MIGIYGIKNIANEMIYVGQSIVINKRFVRHRYELNKNIHKNQHLQRAWNLYGAENFEFIVLKNCTESELECLEEQIEANFYGKTYNISKNFTSSAGEKNSFFGKKHTNESKLKMSKSAKRKYGTDNHNFGKKWTEQQKLKNTIRDNIKLSKSDVLKIKTMLLLGETDGEIAIQFNVSRTVITRIANGTRWSLVTGGPVILGDRRSKRQKRLPHSEATKEKIRQSHLLKGVL